MLDVDIYTYVFLWPVFRADACPVWASIILKFNTHNAVMEEALAAAAAAPAPDVAAKTPVIPLFFMLLRLISDKCFFVAWLGVDFFFPPSCILRSHSDVYVLLLVVGSRFSLMSPINAE